MPRKAKAAAAETVLTTRDALRERFKDFPAIDLVDRRLEHPYDAGSVPILLVDEPENSCDDIGHAYRHKPNALLCKLCTPKRPFRVWYVRWINAGEPERWSRVRKRGYVKVLVKELQNRDDVIGLQDAKDDDPVTRGDRKQELLAKKPFPYYIEERREKQAREEARKKSKQALKESLVASAERAFGDEAGQTMHDQLRIEEIRHERSSLETESVRRRDVPGYALEE